MSGQTAWGGLTPLAAAPWCDGQHRTVFIHCSHQCSLAKPANYKSGGVRCMLWCQSVNTCQIMSCKEDCRGYKGQARPGIKHVMWSFTSLQFWCKLCPQLKPSNLYQNCRLIGNFAIKQQICQFAIVTNFDMLLLFARGSLLSGLL